MGNTGPMGPPGTFDTGGPIETLKVETLVVTDLLVVDETGTLRGALRAISDPPSASLRFFGDIDDERMSSIVGNDYGLGFDAGGEFWCLTGEGLARC